MIFSYLLAAGHGWVLYGILRKFHPRCNIFKQIITIKIPGIYEETLNTRIESGKSYRNRTSAGESERERESLSII